MPSPHRVEIAFLAGFHGALLPVAASGYEPRRLAARMRRAVSGFGVVLVGLARTGSCSELTPLTPHVPDRGRRAAPLNTNDTRSDKASSRWKPGVSQAVPRTGQGFEQWGVGAELTTQWSRRSGGRRMLAECILRASGVRAAFEPRWGVLIQQSLRPYIYPRFYNNNNNNNNHKED